jgi:hypothetical protein
MANTKRNKGSFQPGQTGNPAGRPPGTTPRAKFRKMVDADLPEILEALVTAAKGGDVAAIKVIYDRIVPSIKPSTEDVSIRTTGSLTQRGEAFISAMSTGKLSPEQATLAMGALATQARLIEQSEVMARLDQLEAMLMPKALS